MTAVAPEDPLGASPIDAVLAGGTVFVQSGRLVPDTDVAISGGKVTAIGRGLMDKPTEGKADSTRQMIDCRGKYVVPGLVDAHTHIFTKVSQVGAPPDEAHLCRGVVAAADAGTAGASTFPAFERFVVDASAMRVVCFLNVSVLGLIDFRFGELLNPEHLRPEDALAVAEAHPEIVRGFKIRLSIDVVGDECLPLLEKAVALAGEANLPLMVHIGETAEPLPPILDRLRAGDIVSHCYSGKEHGILTENTANGDAAGDERRILPEVHAARERGVLFDSAHGKTNFSFATARQAISEGFLPDFISSDTSLRNWRGPVIDLVTTMSKLLALGVPLDAILERCTAAPARVLGLDRDGYGTLAAGGPAHVTVLDMVEGDVTLVDGGGRPLVAERRLEPTAAYCHGREVTLVPWRGPASA